MVKIIFSKQLGIGMPKGFPLPIYEKIHSIMCSQKQKYPQSVSEFLPAWSIWGQASQVHKIESFDSGQFNE